MSYPILPPGTLVKPQVRGLNFHWLRVIDDPGPANLARRVVTLARTEPERSDQHVRLRRDRVHADASRMSVFDVKPTLPAPVISAVRERRRRDPETGRFVVEKRHG
jgi:hypothetical protein